MGLGADFQRMANEYRALVARLGSVQKRCSELVAAQAAEIGRLRGEVMRLRGEVIVRDTALACAREDLAALKASVPALDTRIALSRTVELLTARLQQLMRDRLSIRTFRTGPSVPPLADLREKAVLCIGRDRSGASFARRMVEIAGGQFMHHPADDVKDDALFEASLIAADLVICQAGCVSQDAYWRVRDHCRRTGKRCVLVDQPQAMEVLHRQKAAAGADGNDGS